MPGFTFVKLDLADRAATKALFAQHRFRRGDPSRGAGRRALFAAASARLCRCQSRGLHQRAGRLPAQRLRASAVRLVIVGLRRQHQAAVLGAGQCRPSRSASMPRSKKANELMAHSYSHLYRLPTTGLRFFTVYGPWGRPDMAMFIFAKAILAGQPIKLFNHGQMRRDFTYVDDVSQAVVRLIGRPPQGNPDWDGQQARSGDQPRALDGLQYRQQSSRGADARGIAAGEGIRQGPRSRRCFRCSPATSRRPMPTWQLGARD